MNDVDGGILTQDEITEILSGKVSSEEMIHRWTKEDEVLLNSNSDMKTREAAENANG
jgi:hypothetical protein